VGNRSVQHNGSKELVYQQVLRRFAHFNSVTLSNPAPLFDLLLLALDEEERTGRWHESDGPKDQIAQLNVELLLCKAEMLREYFSIDIDEQGNLCSLPLVIDQYTPDMDRLPRFVLNLGNNVSVCNHKLVTCLMCNAPFIKCDEKYASVAFICSLLMSRG
jgi:DNA mismatch repair protein MLH1